MSCVHTQSHCVGCNNSQQVLSQDEEDTISEVSIFLVLCLPGWKRFVPGAMYRELGSFPLTWQYVPCVNLDTNFFEIKGHVGV